MYAADLTSTFTFSGVLVDQMRSIRLGRCVSKSLSAFATINSARRPRVALLTASQRLHRQKSNNVSPRPQPFGAKSLMAGLWFGLKTHVIVSFSFQQINLSNSVKIPRLTLEFLRVFLTSSWTKALNALSASESAQYLTLNVGLSSGRLRRSCRWQASRWWSAVRVFRPPSAPS